MRSTIRYGRFPVDPGLHRWPLAARSSPLAASSSSLAFPVDIVEEADGFEILADLPGCRATDLQVDVKPLRVTIQVARPSETDSKRVRQIRCERMDGILSRSFTFDSPIDVAGTTAHYEQGVLRVRLPRWVAQTRRVPVITPLISDPS